MSASWIGYIFVGTYAIYQPLLSLDDIKQIPPMIFVYASIVC